MKYVAIPVVWLCLCSTGFSQGVGDRVIVLDPDAKLMAGSKVVAEVESIELTILKVNAEWFWVTDDVLNKSGWINRRHVASPDRAIEILGQRFRRGSPSAGDYQRRGSAWSSKGEFDIAIADFNEGIRISPSSEIYNFRGIAWNNKAEYDKAIADYSEAIRLKPDDSIAYNNRGNAWDNKGEYDKAITDYSEAIRLKPDNSIAYYNRGITWNNKAEYDKAIADYSEAIRLKPDDSAYYNGRAWIYATCLDARFRNGDGAVNDATKACELTDWKEWTLLDTLAAAYAENGDFANAVKWQEKSIDAAPENEKTELQSRLELYKSRQPYREIREK